MKKIILLLSLFIFTSVLFAETIITTRGKRMEVKIVKISNEILTFTMVGDDTEYTMSLEKIQKVVDFQGKEVDLSIYEKNEVEPDVNYNGKIEKSSEHRPKIEMKGSCVYIDGRRVVYKKALYSFEEYCNEAYIKSNNFNRGRKWDKASNKIMYYGLTATAGFGLMYVMMDAKGNSSMGDSEPKGITESFTGQATLASAGVVVVGALIKSVCAYHRYSVIKKSVRTYNNKCYQPEIALDAYIAPGQVGIALNF